MSDPALQSTSVSAPAPESAPVSAPALESTPMSAPTPGSAPVSAPAPESAQVSALAPEPTPALASTPDYATVTKPSWKSRPVRLVPVTKKPKWRCCVAAVSVDVRVAPPRLCFYRIFYVFLLSLLTRIMSALIIYDKRTLLDIGHRYTNLLQDPLSTNPTWPLEIFRNTKENKGHLNNPRRLKETLRETCWNPQQTEGKGSQSTSAEYSAR